MNMMNVSWKRTRMLPLVVERMTVRLLHRHLCTGEVVRSLNLFLWSVVLYLQMTCFVTEVDTGE